MLRYVRFLALVSLVVWLGAFGQPEDPVRGPRLLTFLDYVKHGSPCSIPTGTDNTPFEAGYALPSDGLTYWINTDTFPRELLVDEGAAAIAAINAAAATWNAEKAVPTLVPGGTTAERAQRRNDGVSTISFGGTPSGSIAAALVFVVNGEVIEADIVLSNGWPWSTNEGASGDCGGDGLTKDLEAVMAHEFGHVVGAKHTPKSSGYNHRTMYPFIANGELFKRDLERGDVRSIPDNGPGAGGAGGAEPVLVEAD